MSRRLAWSTHAWLWIESHRVFVCCLAYGSVQMCVLFGVTGLWWHGCLLFAIQLPVRRERSSTSSWRRAWAAPRVHTSLTREVWRVSSVPITHQPHRTIPRAYSNVAVSVGFQMHMHWVLWRNSLLLHPNFHTDVIDSLCIGQTGIYMLSSSICKWEK